MKNFKFWEAVALLVGTTIGAGILGLPYAIGKFGFIPGILMLIGLGLAIMLINLMLAEVMLRSRFKHQISGYAKKYLGKWAQKFEYFSLMVGSFGAMVAYTIGLGEVIEALIGGEKFINSLICFALVSVLLWLGLRVVKVFEFWMTLVIFVIILILFFISSGHINLNNLQQINWANIFFPYGVLLFSFGGTGAIFSLREILRGQEKLLKKAIITASVIPIVIYSVFAFLVIGVNGLNVTEVATIGLGEVLGTNVLVFANLFAFFTMGTSFLIMGLTLIQMFKFDVKISKFFSWLITIICPLLFFLFAHPTFIKTMGTVGSLTMGISGILVVLVFWKAKKIGDQTPVFSLPKFKFLGSLLIVMFFLGILYTIWQLFI